MPSSLCKRLRRPDCQSQAISRQPAAGAAARPRPALTRRAPRAWYLATRGALLALPAALTWVSACGPRARPAAVTVRMLENGRPAPFADSRRAILSDATHLDRLARPLCERLSLLEIRSPADWEQLRRRAPELGPAPDFRRGAVFGLASHAGLPLSDTWPIAIEAVRTHDGAGFAIARFHGGSFLPDGTCYLELAQVEGLRTVLMVEVNGVRFFPQ